MVVMVMVVMVTVVMVTVMVVMVVVMVWRGGAGAKPKLIFRNGVSNFPVFCVKQK